MRKIWASCFSFKKTVPSKSWARKMRQTPIHYIFLKLRISGTNEQCDRQTETDKQAQTKLKLLHHYI